MGTGRGVCVCVIAQVRALEGSPELKVGPLQPIRARVGCFGKHADSSNCFNVSRKYHDAALLLHYSDSVQLHSKLKPLASEDPSLQALSSKIDQKAVVDQEACRAQLRIPIAKAETCLTGLEHPSRISIRKGVGVHIMYNVFI